jgi:hypothetical protein
MPEPDFDQIAKAVVPPHQAHCLAPLESGDLCSCGRDWIVTCVAERLRQVWNARGAADVEKLEAELDTILGTTLAGRYLTLPGAIRTLDR